MRLGDSRSTRQGDRQNFKLRHYPAATRTAVISTHIHNKGFKALCVVMRVADESRFEKLPRFSGMMSEGERRTLPVTGRLTTGTAPIGRC
jgi:hypothetical protein